MFYIGYKIADKNNFIVCLFCNTWKKESISIIYNQKRRISFFSCKGYRNLEKIGYDVDVNICEIRKETSMKREQLLKKSTKAVADIATKYLKADADSASCAVFHQPKAPKELARFKKNK